MGLVLVVVVRMAGLEEVLLEAFAVGLRPLKFQVKMVLSPRGVKFCLEVINEPDFLFSVWLVVSFSSSLVLCSLESGIS